jgi:lipopolysaccharide export system protein LptC
MIRKNILFTIVLLAIFVGTTVLALLTAKKITSVQYSPSIDSPDFFMTNITHTKFNHKGNIQNQIKANKVIHFTTNNVYLFEKPNMMMYSPNQQPWHITANKGKSEYGKSTVYLWDNVKIVRTASANNSNFDIATSQLTVYPDIKFAETKEPVTIIQTGNITKATGAKADFKTGTIKLISKVKSWLQVK